MLAAMWQSLNSQYYWDGIGFRGDMLAPHGLQLEPLWKKWIMYEKVALRLAGWRNRAPYQ
jgi:hypothetical protein